MSAKDCSDKNMWSSPEARAFVWRVITEATEER